MKTLFIYLIIFLLPLTDPTIKGKVIAIADGETIKILVDTDNDNP